MADLDFSGLDSIAAGGQNYPGIDTGMRKSLAPLTRELEKNKAEREASLKICQDRQEAAQRISTIRASILHGLSCGENLAGLFLQAMEALALLTDNRTMYDQAAADISAVYACSLHEPAAVELEVDAIRDRLAKIEAARRAETGEAACRRMDAAIAAHKAKLQQLQGE